jgi:DNA polymerase-3 subunit gamma/tau
VTELYKKYRPTKLNQIIGQDEAVEVLKEKLSNGEVPHAMLFSGPSGCGKTTLARIMAMKLKCVGSDLVELNISDNRGIDTVRDINSQMRQKPWGKSKIWILDEMQTMRAEPQNALLKILEDCPNEVYFMLATTEPHKLIKTVRNRCTDIKVKLLDKSYMKTLVDDVLRKERKKLKPEVKDKLIEAADGSPRRALVILDKILVVKNSKKQLNLISSEDSEKQAIELCRLLWKKGSTWKEVTELIKQIEEEPETVRRMMLGYASTIALSGNEWLTKRAIVLIDCFSNHYYDNGRAGLILSCNMFLNAVKKQR